MTKSTPITPQAALVPRFLLLTFGFSWGFWALAIVVKHLLPDLPLHYPFFIAGSFGPAYAACRLLQKSWKDLPAFLFSGRKGTWLYTLIFSGALILIPLSASIGGLREGALARIPVGLVMVFLMGGGNEEPGWRGFLQPALEKKYSFPIATLMMGVIWALWHIPAWFYHRGQSSFFVFLLGSVLISFCYAGLYKRTQSIFACMVFHAFSNSVPGSFHGIGEAMKFGDLEGMRPLVFFGGLALLISYSIWLWYQSERREKGGDAHGE